MKEQLNKTTPPTAPERRGGTYFERSNFLWMAAGAALMVLGYLLMSGGASEDPNVFDPSEVYSTTRITIAPLLILAGLALEIFAIFRTPTKREP